MADERDIGAAVLGWRPPKRPAKKPLQGRYCRLEPLDFARHGKELYEANICGDRIWDFLPYGPFGTIEEYEAWVNGAAKQQDPFFYAIKNLETERFEGVASYLRITPEGGSIEVGHINFAPPLQRTRAATDAMFQMMRWAFEAGYRRYEWKCNALNMGSRRAAQRLGLSYEGIFRQATLSKGHNRDTAWFAAIDGEWPSLKDAFTKWLDDENFTPNGEQKNALSSLMRPLLHKTDPEAHR